MSKTNIHFKLPVKVATESKRYEIIARVSMLLVVNGWNELVAEFVREATSGDYTQLCETVRRYVVVE